MKLTLMAALMLIGSGQLVWADDQIKAAPRPAPRNSPGHVSADSVNAPRPAQTAGRRPPNSSRTFRPLNPNPGATAAVDPRLLLLNRNRTMPRNDAGEAINGRNQSRAMTPNQRVTTNNLGGRTRLPARTGNELSFAQARSRCTHDNHDRNWWRHHHTVIVFYGGGYWFWNAGWWFPAWGYSPYYNNYVYYNYYR